ncbi:MAG: porphobilinogen synthase [Alphaproteobacteria bacterium]|nr:porphobilinogen synthase [Alphaproteobacteria bacterium]
MADFPARRPRRLRTRGAVRDLVREHALRPEDLIQPHFVYAGAGPDVPIASMPGQARLCEDRLVAEAARAWEAGVRAVALFPKVDDALKSLHCAEAWNDEGLVPRIVRRLKAEVPDLLVITDVALDPYSSLGQDGIVVDGRIDNDVTLDALVQQAACHARAGADMVAPSDMMDGRVGRIRAALDAQGSTDTLILAYSAKYASSFYGPFRDALDSAPRGGTDKRTYQMDPGNGDEALQEVALDLDEGADIVMVKPGMPYLDIVWRVKEAFGRPVAVYQVSGEYAMFEAAGRNGWIDRDACVLEALLGFKRAGADMILTYYATEVAERFLRR